MLALKVQRGRKSVYSPARPCPRMRLGLNGSREAQLTLKGRGPTWEELPQHAVGLWWAAKTYFQNLAAGSKFKQV